jgi:protein O-mannosyl-transferase
VNRTSARWNILMGTAPACIAGVLFLITVAVYLPSVRNDFINFDDPDYVYENPVVLQGLTAAGVGCAFTSSYANNWHPLTWISHMLDVQLYGMRPGGHHLTSLLLHSMNTAVLFLVLNQLTRRIWPSALVAALFGLHPIHVESVAWVAERKDVLSTLFFLLTIWAYGRYVQCGVRNAECGMGAGKDGNQCGVRPPSSEALWWPRRSAERGIGGEKCGAENAKTSNPKSEIPKKPQIPNRKTDVEPSWSGGGSGFWYGLALVFFALGLMSKPMVVTLPFVLLLLDYWPLGRSKGCSWKFLVIEKAPFFLLSLGSAMTTLLVQRQHGNISSMDVLPIDIRIATAIQAYVSYIWKMLWPRRLAVFYPFSREVQVAPVVVAAAILIVISAVAYRVRKRAPYVLIGWLWFLGTLVPVIGLVQVGSQSMADRYSYIPSIGTFLVVVRTVAAWASHKGWTRQAVVAGVGLLIACVTLTERQIGCWRNSAALFQHALDVAPNNPTAQLNLGAALVTKQQFAQAEGHFEEALRLKPGYASAEGNLGFVLAIQGKTEQAVQHYRTALKLAPGAAKFHYLLASALLAEGKTEEAIDEFKKELEINPDHPLALNDLAWIKATSPSDRTRNGLEAVRMAERACEVSRYTQPQFIGTLAAAYAEAGRFEEAIRAGVRAKALAEKTGQMELAAKNDELLKLYREHRPYREALNR